MVEPGYDPYECHARHFLSRLQGLSNHLSQGDEGVDALVMKLDKAWPQVLAAFWWAAGQRSLSSTGQEITDALLACADSDIVGLQMRRRAAELRKLSDAIAQAARRQSSANDAAFLYRFAGITKVQATVLQIAENTGAEVGAVLEGLKRAISKTVGGEAGQPKSDQPHRGDTVGGSLQ